MRRRGKLTANSYRTWGKCTDPNASPSSVCVLHLCEATLQPKSLVSQGEWGGLWNGLSRTSQRGLAHFPYRPVGWTNGTFAPDGTNRPATVGSLPCPLMLLFQKYLIHSSVIVSATLRPFLKTTLPSVNLWYFPGTLLCFCFSWGKKALFFRCTVKRSFSFSLFSWSFSESKITQELWKALRACFH